MSYSLACSVVSVGVPRVASALCPTPLVSMGVVCVARPRVPAALAGEGLVIPTGPCSRGSPLYFLQLGDRRRGSSVSDGLQRRLRRRVLSAAVKDNWRNVERETVTNRPRKRRTVVQLPEELAEDSAVHV
ncbi:hypothetical protein Taro_042680 [Colocasia esculenta]|uniref:Uncharacterized protein n=1 Tax=Colocasia esculenta TaxID=4460 RepID=A0A843WX45_COLES|nr:hypothetical protein [Colocasia esculenta]